MDLRRARYLNPTGLERSSSPGEKVRAGVPPPSGGDSSNSRSCCSWASFAAFRLRLVDVVDSPGAAASFDISTALAGVFVLVNLSLETDEPGNPFLGTLDTLQNLIFATLAYGLLYVVLRMFAWGPLRYWRRSGLNRFDAVVLVLTLVTLSVSTESKINLYLGETLTFLRIVRLARVFRFIPGYSSTILAFRDILPLLGQQILVLVSFLYVFAVVGMHAFGGRLVRPLLPPPFVDPNPAVDRVARSAYGLYNYYDVVNFDTLPNAMFCQFYLLSINDWVSLMEGCVAATGKVARLYFILFWPINVLFLFNLVIAFITVAFGAEKDRRDAAALTRESAAANEGYALSEDRREAFLAANVFTVGVLDWRQSLQAAHGDVRGWLFTRIPRFGDVYDALYKDDVIKTFPGTLGVAGGKIS